MLNDVTEQKLYKTKENHLIINQTSVTYKKLGMVQHTKTEPSKNYHYSIQICMETVAKGHKREYFTSHLIK